MKGLYLTAAACQERTLVRWKEVKRRDDYPAIFVKDGSLMISLWKTQTDEPVKFDRKMNVGLYHSALRVDNQDALFQLQNVLKENHIAIEFEPTLRGDGQSVHMMCYEPSGIRIEFYYAA